jgi:DUF1009 family protein
LGQLGRLTRLLQAEQCRNIVFIGGLVRPSLSEIRLDFETVRVVPRIVAAFRGGDNHLLTRIGQILETRGFRMLGVKDVAPDLLMPAGLLTRTAPDDGAQADIEVGLAALQALSPFDIGQAVVVIDRHVVAVEGIEGTDAMLARVVQLRADGRIRVKAGRGVLVKAPKTTQDLRYDLPTFCPKTVTGATVAGLAGIAIIAGQTLIAEPDVVVREADNAGLFVTGLPA